VVQRIVLNLESRALLIGVSGVKYSANASFVGDLYKATIFPQWFLDLEAWIFPPLLTFSSLLYDACKMQIFYL
jgi:hypothetical protein